MVRVIGDGGMSFYIKDFAVIPSYQSKGIGRRLIESVEKYIKTAVGEWAVRLELISTIEAYGFLILENLKEKTGIQFAPFMMDVETIERFYMAGLYKELTASDVKVIKEKNLIQKQKLSWLILQSYGAK